MWLPVAETVSPAKVPGRDEARFELAEQMRGVALTLRTRIEGATPGPWISKGLEYGGIVGQVRDHPDDVAGYGGELICESVREHNRRYLALVVPATGAAIADLLCQLAPCVQAGVFQPAGRLTAAIRALIEGIEDASV